MPSASLNLSDLNGSNGFVIEVPNNGFNRTTIRVRRIGDINGDGFTDLLVETSSTNDPGYDHSVFHDYVLFGGTNLGAGGSIDLSSLDGSNGFAINGIQPSLNSHWSISSDINGDGINDLIISDSYADPNGVKDAGSIYVVYGGTNLGAGGSIDLSSLDGSNGFAINGINQYDLYDSLISSNSDINADGITDLIISASGADPNGVKDAGSVYVVYGGTTAGANGSINLSNLNGSNGFTINGINPSDFLSYWSISSDRDINADGIADLIIHASDADPNGIKDAGSTYVVYGGTNLGAGGSINLSSLDGSNGFAINGINSSDFLNSSISNDSDINGDGITDLIISAPYANPNGVQDAGSIYVVYGGTTVGAGGSINLSSLDGSNGFAINGINPFDRLSYRSISSDRDINADGITDIIIRTPDADPNGVRDAGSIYVVYGGTTAGANGSIDLSNLDGSNGFAINGINPSDQLGSSISSDRDINADGINDLIIGVSNADPNGVQNAGSVYVVYGGTKTGAGGSIDLSNLDSSNGFVINGINPYDFLGSSIVGAGDINNDGIDDVVIQGRTDTPIYVIFGSTTFQLSPRALNDKGITTINTPLTVDVLANDSDSNGNPVQINTFSTTSTKGGTVTLNDNGTPTDLTDDKLVYAPPNDFIGFDSFSYTIDNTQGNKATATVDVKVFSQVGTPNADTIIAGNTGDWIRGAAGNDLITGGDGADQLLGNVGNDTLISGLGNDILCGGWGKDVLTGGEGSDRFWLISNRGTDTITDFQDNFDKLVLFNNLTFEQLSISQSNNNALISVANTGEVLANLTGVQANLLTARDFISSSIAIG